MIKFAWIVYGKLLTEQISIMTLSANLKKRGVDSILIYSNRGSEILREVRTKQPQMIGYSLMYGSHWRYYDLSRRIRCEFPDIIQVAGGPFTTFYPRAISEFPVDATCVGEGDLSLPNVIKKFEEGRSIEDTKGFHFRVGRQVRTNELERLLDEIDQLPFPDRKLFYDQDPLLRNQEFKSFLSGRGCPYPCTYCFNHKFNEMFNGKGRVIRKKSVDYFIEEIKETKRDFGCQFAIFEDDIFILDRAWLESFAEKFRKEVNVPYICYVRANLVNEDVLKLLKESGCHIVRMAIETGNERIRKRLLKRNMSNRTIIRAADLIHQYGLKLSVSNMTGLPTETISALNETIDLNTRCRPDHPTIQFFMPYPNMELSKIAIEEGNFTEDLLKEIPKNTWKRTPLLFDQQTKKTMEKIQKIFPLIVRFPRLRRMAKLAFFVPDNLLYLLSIVVKIAIVKSYFPPTKLGMKQRLGVLARFLSFYG